MGKVKERVVERYSRKRRFYGNQFTRSKEPTTTTPECSSFIDNAASTPGESSGNAQSSLVVDGNESLLNSSKFSSSSTKVKNIDIYNADDNVSGYRFINVSVVRLS